jgi:hypothetical protein
LKKLLIKDLQTNETEDQLNEVQRKNKNISNFIMKTLKRISAYVSFIDVIHLILLKIIEPKLKLIQTKQTLEIIDSDDPDLRSLNKSRKKMEKLNHNLEEKVYHLYSAVNPNILFMTFTIEKTRLNSTFSNFSRKNFEII